MFETMHFIGRNGRASFDEIAPCICLRKKVLLLFLLPKMCVYVAEILAAHALYEARGQ